MREDLFSISAAISAVREQRLLRVANTLTFPQFLRKCCSNRTVKRMPWDEVLRGIRLCLRTDTSGTLSFFAASSMAPPHAHISKIAQALSKYNLQEGVASCFNELYLTPLRPCPHQHTQQII